MSKKSRTVLLFVPADRPDFFDKAFSSGADSIIFDLEDAVTGKMKDKSRKTLEEYIINKKVDHPEIAIRINPLSTPWGNEDLRMALSLDFSLTVLVPKAEPETVREIDKLLGASPLNIICLIETARGLQRAYETALASQRIGGLMLGAEDLALEMNLERTTGGEEIAYGRQVVALAAYAAGIQPIDTPYLQVSDMEGLRLDTENARKAGFSAKATISPRQIPVIREAFRPGQDDFEKALKIVRAAEEAEKSGRGIIMLNGCMIDEPVVARARHTLKMWKEAGGNSDG